MSMSVARSVGILYSGLFVSVAIFPQLRWLLAVFVLPLLFKTPSILRNWRKAQISLLGFLIFVVIIFHAISYLIGPTPYWAPLAKEAVIALFIVALFSVATIEGNIEEICEGFWNGFLPVTAVLIVLGIVKYILLLNGYVIDIILESCGNPYPRGTNLCVDYNIFGIITTVALTGMVARALYIFKDKISVNAILIAATIVFLFAILNLGSRRAYFLLPVPVLMIILLFISFRFRKSVVLMWTVAICASGYFFINFNADIAAQKLSEGAEAFTREYLIINLLPRSDAGSINLTVYPVDPARLAPTMAASQAFGFDSRLARWRLAGEIIEAQNFIMPSGFSYHERFSCQFVGCAFIDYPHSPLLSAWIYGGVLGFVVVVVLYFYLGLGILRAGTAGIITGASPSLVIVTPSTLISGDTILSISQFLIAAFLLEAVLISRRVPGLTWAPFRIRSSGGSHVKRTLDLAVSIPLAVLLAIPALVIAALVRIRLGSPVLFRQQRPGLNGEIFTMLKFRTMTDARDGDGNLLPDGERLTPFGKWLRATSLDELPELINVIRGEMSLVGPRPLLVEYLPLYTKEQARRHEVRPGITGWAQVNGRNALTWEEKFAHDVWYVDNRSLWLDVKILAKTVGKVLRREGVSAAGSETAEKFTGAGKGR